MRGIALICILAAGVVTAGCKKQESREEVVVVTPPPVAAPQAEKGAALFVTKCAGCHKVNGAGGTAGSDLSRVGTRHDAVFLETLLQNPGTYYPKGVDMPAFKDMPKEDMDSLIAYLLTLK
jgi:mono/diheme cytochrome c family protein